MASNVCGACATDHVIAADIEADGDEAICTYCGKTAKTITLSDLASRVHEVFEKYAVLQDDVRYFEADSDSVSYEGGGETPSDLVQRILECDPKLADDLVGELADLNWRNVKDGGDDYYALSESYALEVPSASTFDDGWHEFVESVKHDSRFFNAEQGAYLERILKPLLHGDLHGGSAPIIEIGGPDSTIKFLYRAREASNESLRKRIYANPARELAPPPPTLRTQGRMNAAGIRAFYGCTDITTCVAEIRAPVGATIVVGKFSFLSPCRVLDLRLLDQAYVQRLSYFDPDFEEKVAYGRFIRRLHNLIRAPVLPGSESLDYLPTQILAEYLEHRASSRVDGVMFVSSLADAGPDEEKPKPEDKVSGINVVLFAGASVIVNDLAKSTVRVVELREPLWGETEFDIDESAETEPLGDDGSPEEYPRHDAQEPTLTLEVGAIRVVRVRGIRYGIEEHGVTIAPREKSDPASDLPF